MKKLIPTLALALTFGISAPGFPQEDIACENSNLEEAISNGLLFDEIHLERKFDYHKYDGFSVETGMYGADYVVKWYDLNRDKKIDAIAGFKILRDTIIDGEKLKVINDFAEKVAIDRYGKIIYDF